MENSYVCSYYFVSVIVLTHSTTQPTYILAVVYTVELLTVLS